MSSFANVVESNVAPLLQRWIQAVEQRHAAGASSRLDLGERLPGVLRLLVAALRRGDTGAIDPVARLSEGTKPLPGAVVQDLVHEYGMLGDLILDLAQGAGIAVPLAEVRIFNAFMAAAIADGVAVHARFREAEERRLALATTHARDLREAGQEQLLTEARAGKRIADAEVERLRQLFEHAPMPMCLTEGPTHTFTFANAAYRALVGHVDLVGKAMLDALPELRGQGFDTLLDAVLATGRPFIGTEVPVTFIGPQGEQTLYFNFVYQPRGDAAGEPGGVLVSGSDVTEQVEARKRIEVSAQALRESEERLRRVIEATGAGTWSVDLKTRALEASTAMRALHGFCPEGPLDVESAMQASQPAEHDMVRAAMAAALDAGGDGRYHVEYRATDVQGRRRWIESRGRTTLDGEGQPVRFQGTSLDITARKEAELAREGLLAALEVQPFLQVCVLEGRDSVYRMVNPAYREQAAFGRDVVGRKVFEVLPEYAGQGFEERLTQVMDTGTPFVGHEFRADVDRGSGVREETYFNFVYQPVPGSPDTVLSMSIDVTEVVLARRRLERSTALEKERADFERQLIGIVSHDLKNPLAAVLLGTNLLARNETLDPRSLKAVLRIQGIIERTVKLVNDLLDFTQARLGAGLPMAPREMKLHAVVREVLEEVQLSFPERELVLHSVGDDHGTWDPDRIGQVALNLLTNALKYSPVDTPVQVSTRVVGERVELTIQNGGAPLEMEALSQLFEPLQRASTQSDRTGRSVGLGLFIVKHIVDSHRGSIAVSSSADTGTTFTVTLPRQPDFAGATP